MAEDLGSNTRGQFAAHAAESLLRLLGAANVTLRFLASGDANDAQQLGLKTPDTEDVVAGPALVRDLPLEGNRRFCEVLVTLQTVQAEMDRRGEISAESLFSKLTGVVRDDMLWRLVSISSETFAGSDYLYRLKVAE